MYDNSDSHMNKDPDQHKSSLDIDQEYEEIGSVESPNPHDFANSVHFILDEQTADESYEQNAFVRTDTKPTIPTIEVNASCPPTIPTIEVDVSCPDDDSGKPSKLSVINKALLHDNYNNNLNNKSAPRDRSKNERDKQQPSFKENTGGLSSAATLDTKNTLFFNDRERRIDLVLVYEDEDLTKGVLTEEESLRIDYRRTFQESLFREGLELEIEDKENSFDGKTCFVKIHCPYHVVEKYAAIMHIKKPVKSLIAVSVDAWEGKKEVTFDNEGICFPLFRIFDLNSPFVVDDPTLHTSIFTQSDQDKLLIKDREGYYTSSQRSQIVWQILLRARFSYENNIGIRKLLNNQTYLSAFPLHEGRYDQDNEYGVEYDRRILYVLWAKASMWYKYQPLWLIRRYFGDKIALYFAWLGFYTNMLILPSIIGLCCFIYGLATMNSSENIPSKEICDPNIAGNITLCPLCDSTCKYQKLGDSCLFSNITYLFDNTSTVFFSIFMSFWATLFLELWKRKQALIAWQWDLHMLNEDDDTRPEYDTSSTMFKINPVTRRKEPFVPGWQKIMKICLSVVVVLFMIFIVLCCVVITIILRLLMFTVISDRDNNFLKTHAKLITSILAALINLFTIIILNRVYHYIALWLTNKENPRTKMQYEKSFIVKIFLFEFMNYYSSLIYIAFFKGRSFTHPGDSEARNTLLLQLKGDVCDPAGCLSELCIQLAIIMIGKQGFSNIIELLVPAVRNWWRSRTITSKKINRELTHWEENYVLQDPGSLALFEEYLEMVIQYGFVTLFVAAFPLAPLFALLNNVCEIRLDAYKMVAQARRPIAERVENIGAWFSILRGLTYCAVVFNAFVISYTSDYIPRKIYQYFYSENNDLVGYIDSSLSLFNTSDFVTGHSKLGKGINIEPKTCQYRGYRYGPEHEEPYSLSAQYWLVFGARLLFVVVFEHIVFTVTEIISSMIPNVPYLVGRQMQLEKLLHEENSYRGNNTKGNMDDYDQFLNEIRRTQDTTKLEEVVRKNTWVRRISRRISASAFLSRKISSEKDEEINES